MVKNQFRKYPMLVYNDITYIPMTWYDSRLFGKEVRHGLHYTERSGVKGETMA
ncbi:Uncharacterised protein [Chlamydia abortus]|uniref:Uncharacterized protein n=1 Tax=Paenibacillus residui TaxID=629724 RepID=A0ABW3DGZ5_9BACL|nr:Uncharacterised protein [Chlamydia abortus]